MKPEDILSSECPQCGAPLIKTDNMLTCKYCGHFYVLPDDDSESPVSGRSAQEDGRPPNQEINSATVSSEQPALSESSRKKYVRYFLVFIIILAVILPIECLLLTYNTDHRDTEIEKTFLQEVYNDTYDSVPYPAASCEDASLSLAVVLENAHADETDYSLFIRNNRDEDIRLSSPSEHLEIESLNISNSLGEVYQCAFEKIKYSRNILQPGEMRQKGVINCQGKLSPEVTSIDISFEMPNWGKYQLQIPLSSNSQELHLKNSMVLTRDNYSIDIIPYSEKLRIVTVYQEDISISDNRGNAYPLDACEPAAMEGTDGDYYLSLSAIEGFYYFRHKKNLIRCAYDGSFPDDVNTVTIDMSIEGETYSSTAVINEPDGSFSFENQSEE